MTDELLKIALAFTWYALGVASGVCITVITKNLLEK